MLWSIVNIWSGYLSTISFVETWDFPCSLNTYNKEGNLTLSKNETPLVSFMHLLNPVTFGLVHLALRSHADQDHCSRIWRLKDSCSGGILAAFSYQRNIGKHKMWLQYRPWAVRKHPASWDYHREYSGETYFVAAATKKTFWKLCPFAGCLEGMYNFWWKGVFLELLVVEKDNLHINPRYSQPLWYPSFNSNFKSVLNLTFYYVLFQSLHVSLPCFCQPMNRRWHTYMEGRDAFPQATFQGLFFDFVYFSVAELFFCTPQKDLEDILSSSVKHPWQKAESFV